MDLGFLAVYNYLKPFIEQDSIVYYKDKMILTDNTRMKAKFLSKEPSDNNQSIVELQIRSNDGTRIIDDYNINLKNKYICTIDDTIESVQIVDHYSNTINDIIKVKMPNYYDVEEIEEICLMPIALCKFSYGKFEMSWRPRQNCLFEGITVNIFIKTKEDEERKINSRIANKIMGILLKKTSIPINDENHIGYFKRIGLPTISKDNDYNDGENLQTSTISISGYYQINYNTEE